MKSKRVVILLLFCLGFTSLLHAQPVGDSLQVTLPRVLLSHIPLKITVQASLPDTTLTLQAGEREVAVSLKEGRGTTTVTLPRAGRTDFRLRLGEQTLWQASPRILPGWLSLVPALMAIFIALISRQVVPSLFLGIWAGAWITYALSPVGLWKGLLDVVDTYVLHALNDTGRLSIVIFSFLIGGMVGIVSRNGGMNGIVKYIVRWARDPRRGQVATGILGVVIFFDDYANTLVVGNTMRPVLDRLRVSREKLAYIVDSTAAPVAALALVTTWIGYEVSLIGGAISKIDAIHESAYSIFLHAVPYSFYPVLAIVFVFFVALLGRDFGPMYRAEIRARTTGQVYAPEATVAESVEAGELKPVEGKPERAINALLPVAVLVFGTLIGLYVTGEGNTLREIIGSADSYKAMLWGSLLGVLTAGLLSAIQRILTLGQIVTAWYNGMKAMFLAIIILTLAWALSDLNEVLSTAQYLISVLSEQVHPAFLPAIIFVLSAASAFATGSSWGVMGIMMPLVIPLAWGILDARGMTEAEHLHMLYATIASVLAGAVWGDHCSPISDTTILSSMASACDHIDHVRTQLPYALTVGFVALFLGLLPAGFGLPLWISFPVSMVFLLVLLWFVGKPVDRT